MKTILDLRKEFEETFDVTEAYLERETHILERIRALSPPASGGASADPTMEISKGLDKLMSSNRLMKHKIAALKSGISKADLAAVKQTLRVQRDVVKLANKQADVLLKHLDRIAKAS